MKIDGHVPADPELATKVGVELNYRATLGDKDLDFNFRAKSSGKLNKEFQKALTKLGNKRDIRAKTGYKTTAIEDLREVLEIWAEHVVMNWTTTATSGGTVIKPTNENFVELFGDEDEVFLGVFNQLAADCAEIGNFKKEVEAEAVKN